MSDFEDDNFDNDSISSSEQDNESVHIGGANYDVDVDTEVGVNEAEVGVNGDDEEEVEDDDDESTDIPPLGSGSGLQNEDDDSTDIAAGNDSDSDEEESYLQKFNAEVNKNYIVEFHPECMINNYDEISAMTNVIRDNNNNVIDDLHRTIPYLTKYEKARVLGQRAKQINSGAKVFVKVPDNVIDGYLIAEIELAQKRVPFIIRRPISGGGCEYWNLKDLEIIGF